MVTRKADLINEKKKRIDNHTKRWRKVSRWKNESGLQNINGRNFQVTKFSFIDFFLTGRRNLSGKRPKSACGKFSSCRFSLSAARNREWYMSVPRYGISPRVFNSIAHEWVQRHIHLPKKAIEDSVIGFGLISCKPQRLLERFFRFCFAKPKTSKVCFLNRYSAWKSFRFYYDPSWLQPLIFWKKCGNKSCDRFVCSGLWWSPSTKLCRLRLQCTNSDVSHTSLGLHCVIQRIWNLWHEDIVTSSMSKRQFVGLS